MHRRVAIAVLILGVGCKPEPEPPEAGPTAAEATAPAGFDELRASEDRALLTSLVGPVDLGEYEIRAAHDLGTTRMVLLDRPGQEQSVSVIDMAPPEDLTADQLRAALAGGPTKPLEVLGYDSVRVLEHRADWVRISWTRDGEQGEGTVRWIPCGDRWLFVSEEITGGAWTDQTGELVGRFQLCAR
jgi:hypothetical protein